MLEIGDICAACREAIHADRTGLACLNRPCHGQSAISTFFQSKFVSRKSVYAARSHLHRLQARLIAFSGLAVRQLIMAKQHGERNEIPSTGQTAEGTCHSLGLINSVYAFPVHWLSEAVEEREARLSIHQIDLMLY